MFAFEEPSSPQATHWKPLDTEVKSPDYTRRLVRHDMLLIPSQKNQDWVAPLCTREENPALVVLDGHGAGKVVETLKTLNWGDILAGPDPVSRAKALVDTQVPDTFGDGSTFASAELLPGGVRCRWLGDTEILVFHEGALQWRSSRHTTEAAAEVARLAQLGIRTNPAYSLKALSRTDMTMTKAGYCQWQEADRARGIMCDETNLTRGFGHSGPMKASSDEMQIVRFHKPGNWRVVVYTDGVGDVTAECDLALYGRSGTSSREIAELAKARWDQEWVYHPPTGCGKPERTKIGKGAPDADDIGVGVMEVEVSLSAKKALGSK